MKTTSLLLTLASVHGAFSSVFPRAECKADTCLRGVPGNEVAEQPLSLRQADCSTYMTRYVSPSPTTITSTISTVTVTSITAVTTNVIQPIAARQEPVPTKPAYASYCVDEAAYSSACSCIGITATRITKAQYTAHVLEIATVTAVATVTVVQPCS